MRDRDRINWGGLEPLKRCLPEKPDLDAHADRKFHRNKAKHNGRPHWWAHQARQRAEKKQKAAKLKVAKRSERYASYVEQVRAYWRGETDDHP